MTADEVVVLEIKDLIFFSPRDEDNLFEWINAISAVRKVFGLGDSIFVEVAAGLGEDDLSELIAVFKRYGVDMKQFSVFDDGRFPWLRKKGAFWCEGIFG